MFGRSRDLSVSVVVVLALCSCDRGRVPTQAAPSTPTPAPATVTISGVVIDHTSAPAAPLAGVTLLVHTWQSPGRFIQVTSDSKGHYSVSDVPSGAISIAPAGGSGYYAPCPAGDLVRQNSSLDVHVVSATRLATTGVPEGTPTGGSIWVSGVVFETTAQGRRPIAGASVNLGGDASDSRLGSTTLTDAAGHYLVCPTIPSAGTDQTDVVRASRDGYRPASRSAFLGWDYNGADIELMPN